MCETVKLPNGQTVRVCGMKDRPLWCVKCARAAKFVCDWKVAAHKTGTCDAPICALHSKQVEIGKHLCPEHQLKYDDWRRRHPEVKRGSEPNLERSLFEEAA